MFFACCVRFRRNTLPSIAAQLWRSNLTVMSRCHLILPTMICKPKLNLVAVRQLRNRSYSSSPIITTQDRLLLMQSPARSPLGCRQRFAHLDSNRFTVESQHHFTRTDTNNPYRCTQFPTEIASNSFGSIRSPQHFHKSPACRLPFDAQLSTYTCNMHTVASSRRAIRTSRSNNRPFCTTHW